LKRLWYVVCRRVQLVRIRSELMILLQSSVDWRRHRFNSRFSHKVTTTHATNIKSYQVGTNHLAPQQIATQNAGLFEVEAIVGHKGSPKRRGEMLFKVKWLGFPESKNTWESHAVVRDTQAFVDYCSLHKLKAIIVRSSRMGRECNWLHTCWARTANLRAFNVFKTNTFCSGIYARFSPHLVFPQHWRGFISESLVSRNLTSPVARRIRVSSGRWNLIKFPKKGRAVWAYAQLDS